MDFLQSLVNMANPEVSLTHEKKMFNKKFFLSVQGEAIRWSHWDEKEWVIPLELSEDTTNIFCFCYVDNKYKLGSFRINCGFDMDTMGCKWEPCENVSIPTYKKVRFVFGKETHFFVEIEDKILFSTTNKEVSKDDLASLHSAIGKFLEV